MIVKDESKVILRCLNSVVKYIDSWCICDTGSTDDTCEKIETFFKKHKKPGKLLKHEWKNFGHNRTLAVENAKGMADYLLLMDADFIFKLKNAQFKHKPWTAGSLLIKYDGLLDYRQPLMVKGDLDWRYIGVTHEYIHCPNTTRGLCDDFIFQHVGDGANKVDKFDRDIKLLTDGLVDEPDNMRYYFYLGQSHKDLAGSIKHKYSIKKRSLDSIKERLEKNPESENETTKTFVENLTTEVNKLEKDYRYNFQSAINAYSSRIQKHDFPEEVYFSMYMIGHCNYHLDNPPAIFTGWFLEAYAYRPQRLEALYQMIKYYRLKQKYQLAYDFGRRAADAPYPKTDCLFIDSRIHKYLLKHEVAISAYYIGEFAECLRLLDIILLLPDLPDGHRKMVSEHKRMAQVKLSQSLSNSNSLANQKKLNKKQLNPNQSITKSLSMRPKRERPLITFFSYNFLETGGSEISDWGLLKYLEKECNYQVKHSRDYREIIQDRPDLILAQQYAIEKGVEIGEQLNIPLMITQHGPSQWGHARRSNYFLFNSYHLAESEIPRAQFEHFDVVYPRVDTERFEKVWESRKDKSSNDFQYITFMGRPTKQKGIELFFKLAENKKLNTNHKFLFVGGNPKKEEWDKLIPDNVEVRPFTKMPEEIYAISKVMIVPSHYEAFGMVTIEASVSGVPVVATALPGIREATCNMSNYVDSFDDVEMWEDRILEVLEDYDDQVLNSRKIAQEYNNSYQDQVSRLKYNVDRLIRGEHPCPWTRGMTFSITVTVYNRPKLIIRALESVLWQTYRDWELVVVDDCSTDETWEELCKFHRKHAGEYRIKLIQNDVNRGTFYSRNVGIVEAEGEFIVNLDSDDLLIPSALERLKDCIWRHDANIVQFKFWRDENSKLISKNTDSVSINNLDEFDDIATNPEYKDGDGNSWGLFCFNKRYVEQHVGYYDPIRFGADTEFMCRLKNFHRVVNLGQILYYASKLDKSLSTEIRKEWSNQYLRNFMDWYKRARQTGEPIYIGFNKDKSWEYIRPFELPI
tara:strand:- start:4625 stop:7705 length:3081 start_codon:yes stop_codon:yes gene_type:complete